MKINNVVTAVGFTVFGFLAIFAVAIYLSNQNIETTNQYERHKRTEQEMHQKIQSVVSPLNKVMGACRKFIQDS